MTNYTFRFTAEGLTELKAAFAGAGPPGEAMFQKIAIAAGISGDAIDKAAAKADAARVRMENAARGSFQSLQASLDPVIAAQQRLAQGRETVSYAMARGVATDAEGAAALKKLEEQFRSSTAGVSLFSQGLGTAKEMMGAFGLALTIGGLVEFGRHVLDNAAALDGQAKQLGVGVEALQAYRLAMTGAGGTAQMADAMVERLTRTIGEAASGNKAAQEAFARLGVAWTDSTGNARATEVVISELATAIQNLPTPARRSAEEIAFLGRSGQGAERILSDLTTGTGNLVQRFKDLHEIVAEQDAQKVDDTLKHFSTSWTQFETDITPPMTAVLELFNRFWHASDNIQNALKNIAERAATAKRPDYAAMASGVFNTPMAPLNSLTPGVGSLTTDADREAAQKKLVADFDTIVNGLVGEAEGINRVNTARKHAADQAAEDAKREAKASEDRVRAHQSYIDDLNVENRLVGVTPELREQELAVIRERDLAIKAGVPPQEDYVRQVVAGTQELAKQQRYWQDLFDSIDGAGNRTLKNFFETGKLSGKDFFDTIRSDFAQMLADMVQQSLLRPIELQIVGSMQQSMGAIGSFLGMGGSGATSANVGGFGISLHGMNFGGGVGGINLGSIFGSGGGSAGGINLGSIFGPGGSAAVAPYAMTASGTMSGMGMGGPGGAPASASAAGGMGNFGSILGSGLQGYAIGSANLFGGKQQGSEIGGTLGSIAGQFIGGPIGSFVGSILGSAIGGLFGPKPSNFRADANFNASLTSASYGGDKPNAQTSSMAQQTAAAIVQEIAGLKSYGVSVSGLTSLSIGQRDVSSYKIGGQTFKTGTVGDSGDLALHAIQTLLGSASGGSAALSQVLKGNFGSLDELNKAVQFVTQTYDVIADAKPAATQTETAMKGLVKSFHDASDQAKALGLDVTKFAAGTKKSFDQDIKLSILQIQDPLKYALDLWQRDAQARVDAAAELGGDLDQVRDLNALLYKQSVAQASGGLTGSLQSLIAGIQYGSGSAATPSQQFFSLTQDYNAAKAKALGSGSPADMADYINLASTYLPASHNFLGTSQRYGEIVSDITGTANKFLANLSAPPPIDIAPLVQATSAASAANVQGLSDVKAEVAALNDKMDTFSSGILAVLRNLTGGKF